MTEVDNLEALQPKVQTVTYEVGEWTFSQKPLTFFGKMELFSVLGAALEKALTDVSLTEILDVPLSTNTTVGDFSDTDSFLKAIATLAQYAPDFLKDVYLITLNVPRDQRLAAGEALENELTDDQGFQILEVFVDQNWKVMVDFFSERISPLLQKITAASKSAPSKPSKRSPQRTAAK